MGKSVLIIDGDKQLVPILKDAFNKTGFDVYVETERADALDLVREKAPDLIVLSVELPSGPADGYLACKDLKSDPSLKKIPVLLTSRKAKEEDFAKHRKLKTRADDYLRKPFTDEDLFQRVENLLGFEITHKDYDDLEEKMHSFLEQQAKLEGEIRERDDEISDLKQRLKEKDQEIEKEHHEQVQDLEALLDGYKSKNRELEQKVEEFDDKVTTLLQREEELLEQLSEKETEVSEVSEKISELDQKTQDLEQERSDWSEQQETYQAEVERLQNQLDAAMAEIKEFEDDFKSQQKQWKKLRDAVDKVMDIIPENA